MLIITPALITHHWLLLVLLSDLSKMVVALFIAQTDMGTGLSIMKLHNLWPVSSLTKDKEYKVLWTGQINNFLMHVSNTKCYVKRSNNLRLMKIKGDM